MAGDIYIRPVAFQLPNAIGNFTITDTGGPGLTPKAAMFVLSGAAALDSIEASARISIGFTDGTNHRAVASFAEDNVGGSTADTGRRFGNDKVINITGTASELQTTGGVSATFVSFGTNAVTINVDTASTLRGYVWLFSGADLSANVTSFVANATVNLTQATTAPGFQPDIVFAVCPRTAADFGADAGAGESPFSFGAAGRLPSISQACLTNVAEDRELNTSVGSKPRDNRIASFLTSTAKTIAESAALELTSFDATGFTVTTREGSVALTCMYLSLKLNGEQCHVALPSLNSDTTGISSYTTPGFRGRAVMLGGQVAPTANTISSVLGSFSIGGAIDNGMGGVVAGWNDKDNISTSAAQSVSSASKMVQIPSGAATLFWACSLSQMTATGFDYNVTNADSTDNLTVVITIGEGPIAVSDTEQVSDQTAIVVGLALSDTEEITDEAHVVITTQAFPLSESEEISDQTAINLGLVLSEIEQIDDQTRLIPNHFHSFTDTEEISDNIAFFSDASTQTYLAVTDSEQISDQTAFLQALIVDELEEILENVKNPATGSIVVSETEQISDQVAGFGGRFILVTDTEEISDELGGSLRTAPTHGTQRGTSLQAGAEMGWTYQAGAKRGETLDG